MTRASMGPQAPLDLPRLIDTRLLLNANSGGGKSWALRRLLEQTFGQVQHLVIDPEGEFSTLRERFDYVLAAPKGGDTAADPRTAKVLAERLLELRASAILDIYELRHHERVRFVRLFVEALVDAPKTLWHPALVVLDEAHVYVPQHGEAESSSAVVDLATRGRKRGYCALLATQRLAKLHKDAAAECNNVLIGRTALDVDMKRAADLLGFSTREQQHALRTLKPGEFFAVGPALTTTVARVTVGAVLTTHPKAGGRLAFTPPPPTAKVTALLPKLADLPAEAEARAKTLDDLKAELSAAKRELTLLRKAQPSPVVERVEVPVVSPEMRALIEDATRVVESAAAATAPLGKLAARLAASPKSAARLPVRSPAPTGAGRTTPAAATPRTPPPSTNGAASLTGPEQRILDALAWLESIGVGEPEQTAVAFLAGYTIGGGAWNNPRGSLRTKGLITYRGDSLALTAAGRAGARLPEDVLTTEALHQRVLGRLPGPERKLLRVCLEAYPEAVPNDELARRSGYEPNGGAFNNPRGRLRSLGLIEYPERGMVRARDILFLE